MILNGSGSVGKQMCFGKEINSDVLKLVKDEMNTLVTSVEVNKDAWMQDHKGLKENLCNLTQLFGLEIERLEAKHVALESSLKELKGDQAKITESLVGNNIATKSNASLIKEVKGTLEEQQRGLQSRQDVLEKIVTGLAQGVDKLISKRNLFFKTGNGFSKNVQDYGHTLLHLEVYLNIILNNFFLIYWMM